MVRESATIEKTILLIFVHVRLSSTMLKKIIMIGLLFTQLSSCIMHHDASSVTPYKKIEDRVYAYCSTCDNAVIVTLLGLENDSVFSDLTAVRVDQLMIKEDTLVLRRLLNRGFVDRYYNWDTAKKEWHFVNKIKEKESNALHILSDKWNVKWINTNRIFSEKE